MQDAVLANEQAAYNNNVVKPVFQILSQYPELPISALEYDGLKLEFIRPYIMTVRVENEYIVHENMKLNLVVHGETMDELVESFFESMCFLWRDCAQEDDSNLGSYALGIKKHLLSLVKEV